MRTYLMPRAVRTRFEFSPGFGLPELVSVVAGGVLGLVLQWAWSALPLHGPALFGCRVFLFSLPLASGFMLLRQDATGASLYGRLRAARAFISRPRRYLFRYRGWS